MSINTSLIASDKDSNKNEGKTTMTQEKTLKPKEILERTMDSAVVKAEGGFTKLLILGILAGGFIALAAEGSNMAAFNLFANPETYGLGKVLAGSIFGTGLMLVVLAGGELFTGNTMMLAALCERRITAYRLLRNWLIVYGGNLIGSLMVAWMMAHSGLFNSGGEMLGAVTVNIAAYKVQLSFAQGFILGILCNWLVCLAVWMAAGTESMVGKIFAIFFPIWLFITSGFEHSVANMYYIPAGIFANGLNPHFAQLVGLSEEALNHLNWQGFFVNNLIPVTLGNIVGGGILVAMAYWLAYKKDS
jgi:formate/nitrite transporter